MDKEHNNLLKKNVDDVVYSYKFLNSRRKIKRVSMKINTDKNI